MLREKRQYKRVAIDRKVDIVQANGATIYGRASDLSLGGISVKIDGQLERGALLEVLFNLSLQSGIKRIRAHGRVIYSNYIGSEGKFRIGIEFVDLNEEDRRALNDFLMRRLGMMG